MNFEIKLSNQAILSTRPKSHDKSLNILRTESFKAEIKFFLSNFKWLSVKQKNNSFWKVRVRL